jgi:hypothetical protein
VEAFLDTFRDIIYGACIVAVIMISAIILHRIGIIDFDILE